MKLKKALKELAILKAKEIGNKKLLDLNTDSLKISYVSKKLLNLPISSGKIEIEHLNSKPLESLLWFV